MTAELCWNLFWKTGAAEYYAMYRDLLETEQAASA